MSQIDNIVMVQITRQTAQVDITAFDIPLLLVEMDDGVTSFADDRVRTYTSLEGVEADFGPNHNGYRMAVKLLGGDVRPNQFKIGKVNKQPGSEETYVEALNEVIDFDDTWYAVVAESHEDEDIHAIATVIQAMRKLYFFSTSSQLAYTQAQSVVFTSVVPFTITGAVDGDTVDVKIAGEVYQSEFDGADWGTFTSISSTSTFAGTFTLNPTTGVLTITNSSVNFVVTEARSNINGVATTIPGADIAVTDPVGMDIGQRLKEMGFTRSIAMFSNTADAEWPEAVWVGGNLPYTPGNITWEYKSLPGVTVSRLTDQQINLLEGRGYNYYIPVKGVNITRRGKVVESEWIDTMTIVDWLYARLQEQVYFRMVNTLKIPYTDSGAVMVENEIRSVLSQAQDNGAIDTFTVTSPRVLSIPEIQRAQRIMGEFKFVARLASAVSIVRISGVVHY